MHAASRAVLALALLLGAPAVRAQEPSVQALLEKYNLLGTFAVNCSMPAARTNYYVVRRPLDAGRVQSDIMVGPTERLRASVIDRATGLGPNEITISFTSEAHGRSGNVIRAEPDRHRTLEAAEESGKKTIVDGRQVGDGAPMPWLNKCDPAATRAVFEKYNLLGTFAVDCRKPASWNNPYIVLRPRDSGAIQSDSMVGPKERSVERILDRAAGLGPAEISASSSAERLEIVYRVEGSRFQLFAVTRQYTGEQLIANGRRIVDGDGRPLANAGVAMPWMNKCI